MAPRPRLWLVTAALLVGLPNLGLSNHIEAAWARRQAAYVQEYAGTRLFEHDFLVWHPTLGLADHVESAWARSHTGYIQGYGGEILFEEDLPVEDEVLFGGRIGYNIFPELSLEGTFGFAPASFSADVSDPRLRGLDVNVLVYYGSIKYNLPFKGRENLRILPFVQAGAGAITFDPSEEVAAALGVPEIDSQTNFLFVFGAGFDLFLHKNIALRAEYRGWVHSLEFEGTPLNIDENFFSHEISGGLTVYFP